MANKLKNSGKEKGEITEQLKVEKEETVSWKKFLQDERTWKIIGAASLLVAFFLFISLVSYLFTWKEDQDIVLNNATKVLFDETIVVANLLGRLGAVTSHFFIYQGFGISSLLISCFFFVAGVNLLFNEKIWSLWRTIRYVIIGLILCSVSFSFLLESSSFSYGGLVGKMMVEWLIKFLGSFGTGALLLVIAFTYIIWRFNPAFKIPKVKKAEPSTNIDYVENVQEAEFALGNSINDSYATANGGNFLKQDESEFVLTSNNESAGESSTLTLVEKEPIQFQETVELKNTNEAIENSELKVEEKSSTNVVPSILENELELEVKESHAEIVVDKNFENLPPYEPTLDLSNYKYPTLNLLETYGNEKIVQDTNELENNKNQILNTLRNYDIEIQKIVATVGPTVTLYEIIPAAGVRISRIKNLEDDIALSLAALGIRIIAPIPGKGTIGIEVPNVRKTLVGMKGLLASEKFQNNNYSLPIAIGKKIDNDNFIVDLASMPHLLMAGATGQGKSVGVNAILVSLLYKKHPSQLKFVLIDPKKVELSLYRVIEKHFLAKLPGEDDAIITDTKKVVHTLNALCIEMDNRYDLLKEAGARNIKEYNEKFVKRRLNPLKGHQYLPFIVLVIDEFADLIMTAGKEIEMPIARLAQLARAVGIHLIIATQRPSVNIITGTIKANFPSRIAFKVSSKIDSRTILDAGGAEQLIGKGDMLISHHGEITRLQCVFVDTPEVERLVGFIEKQRGYPQAFLLPEYIDEKDIDGKDFDMNERDSLFDDAARLIVQNQVGSTSLLQRRMKLGYNRAGRLMDQLEASGIVGPNQGSKAREVLVKTEADLNNHLSNLSL
ncbi:MAG: DNA translocase FtsK [Chitinophagaceae bacterium]|nr:MAG: DNA translocase FtsK [Chitinophagaceae bacterium]